MEKLANHIALQSIAEGGMEKQALNVAQLLRMGRNFALRGKAGRFNELMDRRAQAAASSVLNRQKVLEDAASKYGQVKDYLLDEDRISDFDKLLSASVRIPRDPIKIIRNPNPHARAAVDIDAKNDLSDIMDYPLQLRNSVLSTIPTYNSDQLATFSRALKRLDPALHKQVLTTGSF